MVSSEGISWCYAGGMGAIGGILFFVQIRKEKEKKVNYFTFLVYYLPFDSPYLFDKEENTIYHHYYC